jgi:hypothetical protein
MQIIDRISSENRHRAYFPRIKEVIAASDPQGRERQDSVEIDDGILPKKVPLTHLLAPFFAKDAVHAVLHPYFPVSKRLEKFAYRGLAETFSNTSLNEEESLKPMARDHFFLMQAPPFLRGSPSCVMGMCDALVQARFQKTLPPLRPGIEPFWEAIFAGSKGLPQYVEGFRDFFE